MFPHKYTTASDMVAMADHIADLAVWAHGKDKDFGVFKNLTSANPRQKHPHRQDPRVIREFNELSDYIIANKLYIK